MVQPGIYYPEEETNFFQYHLGNLPYLNKQAAVACFHMPYPFNEQFEQQIINACDNYNRLVIIVTEMHPSTVDFVRRYDNPIISYFFCGKLNQRLSHSTEQTFMDWFVSTVYFYKDVKPDLLSELAPYDVKPYYFDALLGRAKPHRESVCNYIKNKLPNKGILTYINNTYCDFDTKDSDKWIWESKGLDLTSTPKWTVEYMNYYGHPIRLSQIVPLSIYNQSAYSVIAETNADDDYVFFTEKTVKPILSKRLFLMSGNQYSLAALREMGFQTFGDIIDESYDSVPNFNDRNNLMLEQLSWLCEQDQREILDKVKPIAEHNYAHMMNTDWYRQFITELGPYFS